MEKISSIVMVVIVFFIVGCSSNGESEMMEQIEAFKNHEQYAIFLTENTENRKVYGYNIDGGNQMRFSYNEKLGADWFNVNYTTSWEKEVDWDLVTTGNGPYVYVGTIKDRSIAKVIVGNKEAKIADAEGEKKFWYYVDKKRNDLEITIVRKDGTEVTLKEKWY